MSRATPQMRELATRLIAHEAGSDDSSGAKNPTVFVVCEKLRPHLATLMGNTGVRALFSRALAQAMLEVPSLHAVHVKADGALAGLDSSDVRSDPGGLAQGSVVVVAQLLGLLTAFIGEKLMLRIVSDAWPNLALNDVNLPERDNK